ncbi:caspase family protein [Sulfurimonas sp.]|nr:caspase family protein [Sulfurimonas sp.]
MPYIILYCAILFSGCSPTTHADFQNEMAMALAGINSGNTRITSQKQLASELAKNLVKQRQAPDNQEQVTSRSIKDERLNDTKDTYQTNFQKRIALALEKNKDNNLGVNNTSFEPESDAKVIVAPQASKSNIQYNKTNKIAEDDFALIIGISNYDEVTAVEFADNSAYEYKKLLMTTYGLPEENIIILVNKKATSGKIKSKLRLLTELTEKNSKIYFYYAGHGVPSRKGDAYILPVDMSADDVEVEPTLRLDSIYKKLANSKAKKIFAVVDSCFSGKDDNGKLLYKGVAPALMVKNIKPPSKMTLITASASKEFANDYQEQKHRMMSYFLIKNMATGEKDIKNTYEYIRKKVKRASLQKGFGYKQVPQLIESD